MQERLFGHQSDAPIVDEDHDPYAKVDEAGRRLADEYGIDPERASDMVLSHGSERAARKVLERRWWMKPEQRAA